MDYFITLNEKSIDAIGEAVEKPITVIEGLKSTIAEQAETIADKDETIAEKDETIAEKDERIAELEQEIAHIDKAVILSASVTHKNNRNTTVSVPFLNTNGRIQVEQVPANTSSYALQEYIHLDRYTNTYSVEFAYADSVEIVGTAPAGCSVTGKRFEYTGNASDVRCSIRLTFN